jgi:hypothetical protein
MEQLTKQQVVLLCLLACFVSSIATGTVIVSLVDQAPPAAISQTVSRVIERVVEKSSPSAPTKETVIVKDDQAVVDAIAKASTALVEITGTPLGATEERRIGVGAIVSPSGRIVASLGSGAASSGESFSAHLDGGNVVSMSLVSTDPQTGLSLFQADQSSDPASARVYASAALADSDSVALGQSVVSISLGSGGPAAATGIVSSLVRKPVADPSSAGVSGIEASASAGSFDADAVLVNLLGEVVGLRDPSDTASGSERTASFIPSNVIKTYATP